MLYIKKLPRFIGGDILSADTIKPKITFEVYRMQRITTGILKFTFHTSSLCNSNALLRINNEMLSPGFKI